MKKKLALLLVFSLIVSLLPVSTFLADEDEDNGYDYEYNEYENDKENDVNDADEDDEDYNDEAAGEDDNDYDDEAADENDYDYDEEDYNDNNVVNDEDEDEEEAVTPVTPAAEVTTLRFVIGEYIFTRNGVAQDPLDAAPFIDAALGRTMVPLAAVAEGLGATVGWDRETRNVTIIRNDIRLVINVDTALPDNMGMPVIIEGRTFVPLAYVAAELGAYTRWDRNAQAVYVWY